MYLHSLTNKIVPDTDSLSINELPKVATSLNNVEYCLNYSQFYQGCSFCGEGPHKSQGLTLPKAWIDINGPSERSLGVTYVAISRPVPKLSSCVIVPMTFERLAALKSSPKLLFRLKEEQG